MSEKDSFEEIFDEVASEENGSEKEETKISDGEAAKPKEGEPKEEDKKQPAYEEIEQKYKSLQGMFEVETKKTRELEERVATLLEQIDKPKPKEELKKEEPKPEEKDPELEKYISDYDYIYKNEAKLRKKEYEALRKELLEEITTKYDISMKTAEKLMEDKIAAEEEEHLGAIHKAHEDYGKDYQYQDIVDWVETLSPSYKRAYGEIIKGGDTEEVIELISNFKEAKGINVSTDKKDETNEEVDIKNEKEKKLKELEAVKSKKSPVNSGSMKRAEDYESAFDEAASVK